MAQKYFKTNLPKLEKLRIARGWSREDLATEAIISTRTLDSIMAGKSAVLSTLSKLAKALETPVDAIVDGFQEPEVPNARCWKVTITLSAPYDGFDETKELPEFLTKLLARIGGDQVLMPEVSVGSIKIQFYLTDEQNLPFHAQYTEMASDLSHLGLVKIKIEPDDTFIQPKTLDELLGLGLEASELENDERDW